ncbi:restriction endonuclease subunit S [Bacteroides ovatus]|uniref:Restriction endonuclease subunit S n=1 Tax=Bacteroides ovatus TaxID=28116 RepID=A0A6A1X1M5_BACOV|nr:restriction endonuclease subunit S [Bacteroides ovatus]
MEKKEKAPVLRFKDTNGKDYPAWEQRKFQEITQRVSTSSISSIDFPSVEYEDIEAGSGTLNKDVKLKEKNKKGTVFNKNDILFGKLRPYLMNWLLADFKGVAVGDFWVLRSQNCDPKFVYSLIHSKSFQEVANRSSGSKMPRADWNLVSNTLFFVPSQNNEQRKIGELFSSLDKVITLHQRKLEALKKLKRTLLQKMFPKKGHLKPELRFFGFTNDWEQRKLGDIGTVQMNKRIFKTQTSTSGEIPFYKIGTFGKIPDAYISRELFEEYKKKYPYPKKGDLLLSASGSIGNVVEYNGEEAYFQDSNIVWLEHGKTISNFFLKAFYSVVNWEGIEGTTIKRLYNKTILDTPITLPSFEEQEKIGNFFTVLDKVITLHQRKLEIYKKLKKGLLQKMFI